MLEVEEDAKDDSVEVYKKGLEIADENVKEETKQVYRPQVGGTVTFDDLLGNVNSGRVLRVKDSELLVDCGCRGFRKVDIGEVTATGNDYTGLCCGGSNVSAVDENGNHVRGSVVDWTPPNVILNLFGGDSLECSVTECLCANCNHTLKG